MDFEIMNDKERADSRINRSNMENYSKNDKCQSNDYNNQQDFTNTNDSHPLSPAMLSMQGRHLGHKQDNS